MTSTASDPAPLPPLDPIAAARLWLNEGRSVALATVVETWGSASVPAGGQMTIAGEDLFQGSVSGGCVEADVIASALDVNASGKPQTLAFGVADETAWRAGLACGGKVRVHIVRLDRATDLALFDRLDNARGARSGIVVATRLADGARTLHTAESNLPGVSETLATAQSKLIADADGETFLHALTPPPRIVIVGATHIGQHLSQQARAIGYEVAVLDPRGAFAGPARFDEAIVTTAWPETELHKFIDPFTAIVTLTHADAIDDEALVIALRSPCRYIGALGSRKTHAKRLERLREAGFNDADINRIRAPIGLDIGAKSAGEIAVSILAEVIAAFRKGGA